MRLWRVVVLVNLALILGVGLGYLRWAAEVRDLREELARARERPSPAAAGPRSWTVRGIVRLVLSDQATVFITHEPIPDLMPGMTMGFPAEAGAALNGLAAGDPVRFTVEERGERLVLVGIEKTAAP